eukprot:227273-Chlamydomonas_euryale.AAC.1
MPAAWPPQWRRRRRGTGAAVALANAGGGCDDDKRWTRNEVLFVSLSWIPKATVQGALSAAPLEAIMASLEPGTPAYDQYVVRASRLIKFNIIAPRRWLLVLDS